jgi:hypothetical protein
MKNTQLISNESTFCPQCMDVPDLSFELFVYTPNVPPTICQAFFVVKISFLNIITFQIKLSFITNNYNEFFFHENTNILRQIANHLALNLTFK